MFEEALESIATCGCGDIGYLATRTLPIDLAHGVGKIYGVPVYHCGAISCKEFTISPLVSRRLDKLAEEMEVLNSFEVDFNWDKIEGNLDYQLKNSDKLTLIQAFTLQFLNREYEDASVLLVVPGQAIFFRKFDDNTEYYALEYEPDYSETGNYLSFSKFYYNESNFRYENFINLSEDGFTKELGVLAFEEVEDILMEEFGSLLD